MPTTAISSASENRQRERDILTVAKHMLLDAPKEDAPFTTMDGQNWLEATVRLGRRLDAAEDRLKANGFPIPEIDERPVAVIEREFEEKAKEFGL